jgi:hypothetical protein
LLKFSHVKLELEYFFISNHFKSVYETFQFHKSIGDQKLVLIGSKSKEISPIFSSDFSLICVSAFLPSFGTLIISSSFEILSQEYASIT